MEEREERIKRLKRLKRKRALTVLVLVVLLAGLGGGYYAARQYREKKAEEEAKRQEQENNQTNGEELTVTTFALRDVAAVGYTNEENSYRFVRTESDKGDIWVREGAEDFPTKNSKIETIIFSLCELTSTTKIAGDNATLSEYGLEKPVISITIALKDGTEQRFHVGAKAPYSAGYYLLQEETGDIWVVAESVYKQFATTEMKLVQEEGFPETKQENITKVEVTKRGEETIVYEPQTAEDGTVTYPAIFADCEKFVAGTIQEYRCTDFAAYGLEEPYLTVKVSYTENVADGEGNTVKEDRTVTLELGDLTVSNNYYARVNGTSFVYIMTAAHAAKYIPE